MWKTFLELGEKNSNRRVQYSQITWKIRATSVRKDVWRRDASEVKIKVSVASVGLGARPGLGRKTV